MKAKQSRHVVTEANQITEVTQVTQVNKITKVTEQRQAPSYGATEKEQPHRL
jgi:hypothetical protein